MAVNDPRVSDLIKSLHNLFQGKASRKHTVRKTEYTIQDQKITSWKFNEFLYKKDTCPFPIMARGLFTVERQGTRDILLRGYDKFFNIGETKKASWKWIAENTNGPYELTVKENGCLILISALDSKSLIVTSKHAINVSHSDVATQWLNKHLEQKKLTKEELASLLFENKTTAVFELCDDDFEEHILEYSQQQRGLYLHGVNINTVQLNTWPSSEVTKLAEQFGFHTTKYYTFEKLDQARAFADMVREEHSLQGRAIEGFVVRCRETIPDLPFMFKIKYDEPYLMYREWREVTRLILGGKPYKCCYDLTNAYAQWVKIDKDRHPELFSEYNHNKGIIAARKRFLDYYQSKGGDVNDIFKSLSQEEKVLLVPVATIACGKTTLSLALSQLFGFGHVQNDNITAKKQARDVFHNSILNQFQTKSIVIADRNNHIGMLRESLTSTIKDKIPNCRIIALYWNHDNASTHTFLKTAIQRVRGRGERHQSLTPGRNPNFDKILLRFLQDFEPLDQDSKSDVLIDDFIEFNPLDSLEKNMQVLIDGLCDILSESLVHKPSKDEISSGTCFCQKLFSYRTENRTRRQAQKQTRSAHIFRTIY